MVASLSSLSLLVTVSPFFSSIINPSLFLQKTARYRMLDSILFHCCYHFIHCLLSLHGNKFIFRDIDSRTDCIACIVAYIVWLKIARSLGNLWVFPCDVIGSQMGRPFCHSCSTRSVDVTQQHTV
jgi:ABC-type uncharacterized transport system permease subunit